MFTILSSTRECRSSLLVLLLILSTASLIVSMISGWLRSSTAASKYTNSANVLKYYEEIPVAQPVMMLNVKGFGNHEELKELGFQEESQLNFPGEFMISQQISFTNLKKIWTFGPDPFGPSVAGTSTLLGVMHSSLRGKPWGCFAMSLEGERRNAPQYLSL